MSNVRQNDLTDEVDRLPETGFHALSMTYSVQFKQMRHVSILLVGKCVWILLLMD